VNYSDTKLFSAAPSPWTIVPFGLVALLLCFVKFPFLLLFTIYQFIELWNWDYIFNEQTVVEKKGIFSVSYREIHYARIKSIMVDQPFVLRLVGLSNIRIKSSDPYMPTMRINAVANGIEIKQFLSKKTHELRKAEGIKEFDMYSL
jgi:uncharacterized membrane protein YdbT with pleckstrin-like domain